MDQANFAKFTIVFNIKGLVTIMKAFINNEIVVFNRSLNTSLGKHISMLNECLDSYECSKNSLSKPFYSEVFTEKCLLKEGISVF